MEFEAVSLTATDGPPLAAWYIPSNNGAAVIVRHGASSSKEAVLDHAAVLAHAGYGVLAMDARGHGDSGGESNAFGWFADDVSIGVDYLVSRSDIVAGRIGALGLSMGGEEVITAAGDDPRIAAVVAEGVTMRSTADFLEIDKGIAMWISAPHYWAMYTTADLLSGAAPPRPLVEAVAAIAPRPLLLIAAGQVDDEQRFAERFADTAPGTTSLWVAPGSSHTRELATAPQEWTERVLALFDAGLTTTQTPPERTSP
jgi:dienelactone hydrolase